MAESINEEQIEMISMWQEIRGYFDTNNEELRDITLDGLYTCFSGWWLEKNPSLHVPTFEKFRKDLKKKGIQIIKRNGKYVCVGRTLKKSAFVHLFEGHRKLKEKELEA